MKQDCIALSLNVAEYIYMCEATKHVVWLRALLEELDETEKMPIVLKEDQGAIGWSKNGPRK